MKSIIYTSILFLILSSCQKSNVSHVLNQAEENRKELEAVLEHYKEEPLKQEATHFLIENMDAHYAHSGEAVDRYTDKRR